MKKTIFLLVALMISSIGAFAASKLTPKDILEKSGDSWVIKSGIQIADEMKAKGWEVVGVPSVNSVDVVTKVPHTKAIKCEVFKSGYIEVHFNTKAETIEFYNQIRRYNTPQWRWEMNANTVFSEEI